MKTAILILITFSLSAERGIRAQTPSTKDVFPLSINNSWTYSYKFIESDIGGADGNVQIDSGLVQFLIIDSISNNQQISWSVLKRSEIVRTLQIIEALWIVHETTYVVIDSTAFTMYELRKDNHLLSIPENVGYVNVWPFYSSDCGDDSVFRYQIVDSSSTTSHLKTTYCERARPCLSMTYQLIFHSDSGLVSNSATGTLACKSHAWAQLSSKLVEKNIILKYSPPSEPPIPESEPILFQNYPNPFNPTTTFRFLVPRKSLVTIEVYNIIGQRVATLGTTLLEPGYYERTFKPSVLSSGSYLYRMESIYLEDQHKAFDISKRMLIIR